MPENDRAMIAGYLINKFRGDASLFDKGLKQITGFTRWPSFGVLPWVEAAKKLPAEDSVALDQAVSGTQGTVKIIVPVMGKIANFDDLDPLKAEPDIDLIFLKKQDEWPEDAASCCLARFEVYYFGYEGISRKRLGKTFGRSCGKRR